jgi:hypothetical protein
MVAQFFPPDGDVPLHLGFDPSRVRQIPPRLGADESIRGQGETSDYRQEQEACRQHQQ